MWLLTLTCSWTASAKARLSAKQPHGDLTFANEAKSTPAYKQVDGIYKISWINLHHGQLTA
jgi:hypothetical protein